MYNPLRSMIKKDTNPAIFDQSVTRLVSEAVARFSAITRNFAFFHIGFFLLGATELFSLLFFFPFFAKSSLVAYCLAAVFLTAFSYFVLRFYLQVRKPEQFLQLKDAFIQSSKEQFSSEAALQAVYRLLEKLEGQEYQYYSLPKGLDAIRPLMEKFSLWCHFDDVFQMKELLHGYCIKRLVEEVKEKPTDPQSHAQLGGALIALYKLYIDPRKIGKTVPYPFILSKYASEEMTGKFKNIARRAIEEFKIIDSYAPSDPWVYAQLAAIYHDLEESEKEIAAYEMLLRISPQERILAYRLGILYFQKGRTADGLKIYDQLSKLKDAKAEELIRFYS